MSVKPLTVVMLCYNSRDVIEPTLESIASQTLSTSQFDLIVSIDGKHDGVEDIAKKIVPHAKIIERRHNMGIVNHVNIAYRGIDSPLVACHDHDDLSMPDRFEYQVDQMMSKPHLVAHVGHATVFGTRSHIFPVRSTAEVKLSYFKANSVISPTAMYRQSLLPHGTVVANPWLEHSEDYAIFADFIARGLPFEVTDKVLIKYHMHDSNDHLLHPVKQNLTARAVMRDLQLRLFPDLRSRDADLLSTLYTGGLVADSMPTLYRDLTELAGAISRSTASGFIPPGFSQQEYKTMAGIALKDITECLSKLRAHGHLAYDS